jgi:hypothetical protein
VLTWKLLEEGWADGWLVDCSGLGVGDWDELVDEPQPAASRSVAARTHAPAE